VGDKLLRIDLHLMVSAMAEERCEFMRRPPVFRDVHGLCKTPSGQVVSPPPAHIHSFFRLHSYTYCKSSYHSRQKANTSTSPSPILPSPISPFTTKHDILMWVIDPENSSENSTKQKRPRPYSKMPMKYAERRLCV